MGEPGTSEARARDAKRGVDLRQRILWSAREIFLEYGFERASMDAVASHAGTTKRTVYAHFENKEKLFVATFEFVRGFFLERLKTPDAYASDPREALALFCARFIETLLWEDAIRIARVCAGEAARFQNEAAAYAFVIFSEVERRIATYVESAFAVPSARAASIAQRLMGRILYPRFAMTLFGVTDALPKFDEAALSPDFDLAPMRTAVSEALGKP